MNDFTVKVLWAYIILLLIGGLIGFFKAKSKVSLISSAVFAALLILTTLRGIFQPGFALGLANVILVVLLLVFAMRLGKTKKFMPSGLILLATVVVLALMNVKFR
ncbi:MAG: TMEM14 family protein [Limisphaerales bacterium]